MSRASPTTVINQAIDDFNDGHQDALGACSGPGAVRPQALLGCAAGRTCAARRPMPLVAGEGELLLLDIREAGAQRAVCTLAAPDGTRLVGLYAVDDEGITAACHYYSDIAMLTELGVLPLVELPDEPAELHAPAPGTPGVSIPQTSSSLGDRLLESRLAHRRQRLRLAIRALEVRAAELSRDGVSTPRALAAAIREFQRELDHAGSGRADDVYQGTTLVGSCSSCRQLVFQGDPHDWAREDTNDPCAPFDDGAALRCGTCAERRAADEGGNIRRRSGGSSGFTGTPFS